VKKMLWMMALLLVPGVSLGANDICVHLNGGDDVTYAGELNTLEIWIENDVELKAFQCALEICWPVDTVFWIWNSGYGTNPPFDRHGDGLSYLELFAHDTSFDNDSCETFAIGATALFPTTNLPPGPSRLCYSLQFGVVSDSSVAGAIRVQPYAYFGGLNWFFRDNALLDVSPDFCGEPVASMSNPTAPAVTFDVVHRSGICGDVDCSGGVDIDDVVYLITYIFGGGNPPCDPSGNGQPEC